MTQLWYILSLIHDIDIFSPPRMDILKYNITFEILLHYNAVNLKLRITSIVHVMECRYLRKWLGTWFRRRVYYFMTAEAVNFMLLLDSINSVLPTFILRECNVDFLKLKIIKCLIFLTIIPVWPLNYNFQYLRYH